MPEFFDKTKGGKLTLKYGVITKEEFSLKASLESLKVDPMFVSQMSCLLEGIALEGNGPQVAHRSEPTPIL